MINLKKLLATLIMTGMLCSGFCTAAFAESTEDGSADQVQITDPAISTAEDAADESEITDDSDEAGAGEDADVIEGWEDEDNTEDAADTSIDVTEDEQKDNADSKASYSKSELRYLSCLIYAEAGNQSYSAMLGVANVVLNRVKSDAYWHVKTIKDVIYDNKWSVQFAVTIKNSKGISPIGKALKAYDTGKFSAGNPAAEKKAMNKAIKAAKAALNGDNNIGSYLCFSNKNYKSYVKNHYSKYTIIDDTIFFRTE